MIANTAREITVSSPSGEHDRGNLVIKPSIRLRIAATHFQNGIWEGSG